MVGAAIAAALLFSILLPTPALAQPKSKFEIMIFPLECEIDLLNTGVNEVMQVTPENCLDEPPGPAEPPVDPSNPDTPVDDSSSDQSDPFFGTGTTDQGFPAQPGIGERPSLPGAVGFESVRTNDVLPGDPPNLAFSLATLGAALFLAAYVVVTQTALMSVVGAWFHRFKAVFRKPR